MDLVFTTVEYFPFSEHRDAKAFQAKGSIPVILNNIQQMKLVMILLLHLS